MTSTLPRRFIEVVPPARNQGLGEALRNAFRVPDEGSSWLKTLLRRLDRTD
ncbi:MAG: hypothetical protein ACK4SZ_14005 [Allosphingosinicella sp.]|uniref:hypothetical protein n=1 Tax=Allosphingosinicella sp. TaxID=2823234 RepID=UPI003938609D